MRYSHISWIIVAAAMTGSPVWAQNGDQPHPLAELAKKQELTSDEEAGVSVKVQDMIQKNLRGDQELEKINEARDRLFLSPVVTAQASQAFFKKYAEDCGRQLGALFSVPDLPLEVGIAAALILDRLSHPAVCGGLAAGLGCQHRAVRYLCAKGLAKLASKLKDKGDVLLLAIRRLGAAGTNEDNDELVQQAIYAAIAALVPKSTADDVVVAAAKALEQIFAARIKMLGSGAGSDLLDQPGFSPAATYFKNAKPVVRSALLRDMEAFLIYYVDRYFDPQTSQSAKAKLAVVLAAAETAIRSMIQDSSGGKLPSKLITKNLSDEAAARKVLQEISEQVRNLQS